jgi:UvrD-like helicase C-terminal domain
MKSVSASISLLSCHVHLKLLITLLHNIHHTPYSDHVICHVLTSLVSQEDDTAPLNLLRLIASPDDDVAFQAALNNDIILSSITLSELQFDVMEKVRQVAAENSEKNFSLFEATRYCVLNKKLSELQSKAIAEFFRKFQVWSTQSKSISKGEKAERIVEDILKSAFPQRFEKIQKAVARLGKSAAEYDSLKQFIAAIQLEGVFIEDSGSRVSSESGISDPSSSQNGLPLQTRAAPKVIIWLMEMHAAKGLEFNEVVLPFWSKGLIQDHPEERKLAFMSLTRAKERVMISYSKLRRVDNTLTLPAGASQFVESLKQIPGLKMKYEDVDYQRFPNLLSKEQQRSIYEARNADSMSSSHRDTTSILTKDASSVRAGMAQGSKRHSPPTTKNIGNANTFRNAEGFQEPLSVPQLGSFTNSLSDADDDDSDDEALGDENSHHSYLKPEILAIMSPDRVAPSKAPVKAVRASVKGVSSANSVETIILKTVAANVEKKKTRGVSAPNEDVLSKFNDPAKCTHAYVSQLLEEPKWMKKDLAIYFRKVLEVQFGVKRGTIQVSADVTRSISSCTGTQIGEHLLGRLRSESFKK